MFFVVGTSATKIREQCGSDVQQHWNGHMGEPREISDVAPPEP
jgi:hypothetical protein